MCPLVLGRNVFFFTDRLEQFSALQLINGNGFSIVRMVNLETKIWEEFCTDLSFGFRPYKPFFFFSSTSHILPVLGTRGHTPVTTGPSGSMTLPQCPGHQYSGQSGNHSDHRTASDGQYVSH